MSRRYLAAAPWRTAILVIAALCTAPLLAQARVQPVASAEEMVFADRVALSPSLEYVLLGVPGISEAPRVCFDNNVLLLRDWDIGFRRVYARPYFGPSTVAAPTTPQAPVAAQLTASRAHSAPTTLPVPLYAPMANTPSRTSSQIGAPDPV